MYCHTTLGKPEVKKCGRKCKQSCIDFTQTNFNAVSLLTYYIRKYYFSFLFFWNIFRNSIYE